MASVTEPPQSESPPPHVDTEANPVVDRQIRRTRRALKFVDMTAGVITLLIGTLIYLLTAAVLEHWVIPGGWGETGRLVLFGLLLAGIGWYCWRTFWPLLSQPINPVYAAQAIEQNSPTLKNSLLNLLLLRSHKRELPKQVFQAIEQQAEQRLSQVRMDTVVDRTSILRLGYILVAIVAVCAVYRLLSPKDLFSSAGRVLAPWANIAAPSRVEILDVTPGDTKAARGEKLEITAEVLGLEENEPVRLLYSTADEQIVEQEIAMSASVGGSRFKCQVPRRGGLAGGGIQQNLTYWIEAGDARSPQYQVAVYSRPTLIVNRLRYEYPAYTGYASRDVEHTGDVRAVEGTKVTVFATANKPIKTAHIDFEADGRNDLLMNPNDLQATVTFPLELREDRRTPHHQSYVLRYTTVEGNKNQSPPKYQIEVIPDYSPEIQLLLPEQAVLDVALNQEVNFEVEARDPDFALRQVVLLGKLGEEHVLKETLLSDTHTGRFVGKLRKTPEQMGLKAGDVLEYWAAAADVRRPKANLAFSVHRKIRVTGPWQGNQENGEGEQQGGDQQPGEGNPQQGEAGREEEGQAGGGEQANAGGEGDEGSEGEAGSGQESGEQGETSEQQGGGEGGQGSEDGENSDSQGGGDGESSGEGPEDSTSENENGEAGDSGGEAGEQGKVSSAGDDDGSAFERMAEHFDKENGEGEGAGEGEGTEGQQQSESGEQTGEGSPDSDQSGDGSESADAQEGGESAGQEGEQQQRSGEGEGAEGEPAPGEEGDEAGGEDQQQQEGNEGGGEKMSPEQGDAGAGEQSGDGQGSPEQEGKSPQEKQKGEAGESGQESQEAPSKGNDQRESDSEGGQSGDRSGGGQEGAGQQADADGTGAAGENQAADEGAGQAQEPGEGDTGQQPGGKQQAKGETGESSGDQAGEGSEQSQQSGEQTGGENASEGKQGEQQGSQQAEGQPSEAGGTGGQNSSPPPPGETMPGDEANLDFAKKKTDLILDRLEDQLAKQQVDKSLLEKLGWTQEELQSFVNRWKNLKAAEQNGSAEAQKELDAALRSLGLSNKGRTGFRSKITKDKLRDLQDAFRGRAPLEYQQQIRAYVKGTATAGETE